MDTSCLNHGVEGQYVMGVIEPIRGVMTFKNKKEIFELEEMAAT